MMGAVATRKVIVITEAILTASGAGVGLVHVLAYLPAATLLLHLRRLWRWWWRRRVMWQSKLRQCQAQRQGSSVRRLQ
jgi:hypothetical protein